MLGTAGTAVGAPVFGLLAMEVAQSGLEDVALALASGLVSYVALLNLPLRRAEIKQKAREGPGRGRGRGGEGWCGVVPTCLVARGSGGWGGRGWMTGHTHSVCTRCSCGPRQREGGRARGGVGLAEEGWVRRVGWARWRVAEEGGCRR